MVVNRFTLVFFVCIVCCLFVGLGLLFTMLGSGVAVLPCAFTFCLLFCFGLNSGCGGY